MLPKSTLYLAEFYDMSGLINMAWVRAASKPEAVKLLSTAVTDYANTPVMFEELIKIDEQSGKFSLAMDHAPIDLDNKEHLLGATLQLVLDVMQAHDRCIPVACSDELRMLIERALEY
jgi:hypothetical protein